MKCHLFICLLFTILVAVLAVCYNDVCDRECREMHFDSGNCEGEECYCYISGIKLDNIKQVNIAPTVVDENPSAITDEPVQNLLKTVILPRICYDFQCSYNCRMAGYKSGYCSFQTCYCIKY
ncbi:uncharacterized protein LOC143909465 [Arctopsyche grandis]|uniref:uncharacterized protein LOC143909465 n=1 Tax=Arctopsyche grandis TaxID=121162 RepID=UPI00406DA430